MEFPTNFVSISQRREAAITLSKYHALVYNRHIILYYLKPYYTTVHYIMLYLQVIPLFLASDAISRSHHPGDVRPLHNHLLVAFEVQFRATCLTSIGTLRGRDRSLAAAAAARNYFGSPSERGGDQNNGW